MLIHGAGDELLRGSEGKEEAWLVVDGVTKWDEGEGEMQSGSVEFKLADKFKKLLWEWAHKLGGVIFASRCGNHNTLFHNVYSSFAVTQRRTGTDRDGWGVRASSGTASRTRPSAWTTPVTSRTWSTGSYCRPSSCGATPGTWCATHDWPTCYSLGDDATGDEYAAVGVRDGWAHSRQSQPGAGRAVREALAGTD